MFEGDGAQASSFSNLKFSEIFDIIIIENERRSIMWRVIFSVYMFVALFDILFFVRTISDCARMVKDELVELEDNMHTIPGWENFEISTHFRVRWLQSYRYFLISLFPVVNFTFMYSFLAKPNMFRQLFYTSFRGTAENVVKRMVEELEEEISNDDCE